MKNIRNWKLLSEEKWSSLVMDSADSELNILTMESLMELKSILEELSRNDTISLLFIESGKPNCFIAGADINEIQKISSVSEGEKMAGNGQEVFRILEDLPFPTCAVINGSCFGGGLELALACTYRVADESSKVRLSLPEVKLGILPGFGGTQRLPRIIGEAAALKMILSGRNIDASRGYKTGLIDAVVPKGYLPFWKKKFFMSLKTDNGRSIIKSRKKRVKKHPLLRFPGGRSILYAAARREIIASTGGHYPAPLAAWKVLKKTAARKNLKGYALERTSLGKLALTRESRHLLRLFFIDKELKKNQFIHPRKKIARAMTKRPMVAGAGVMGGGIAWLFSSRKIPSQLYDISSKSLKNGMQASRKLYRGMEKKHRLTTREAELGLHRITPLFRMPKQLNRDLVIEAIIENSDVKRSFYKNLEPILPDTAIIVSNTSSLLVSELARDLKRPELFAGFHFFNPVNRMPLVEIIPGKETSTETIDFLISTAIALGKVPLVVKDCPGFLVNRILFPYISAALSLAERGISPTLIDKAMKAFGMPMGPFVLLDEIGIDIAGKVGTILEKAYPDRLSGSVFLSNLVSAGIFGKKNHRTIMKEGQLTRKAGDLLPKVSRKISLKVEDIPSRLLLPMINEAAYCLSEGIVVQADYIDMALILGTGFPPFRGGLLRWADQQGPYWAFNQLKILLEKENNQKPCSYFENLSRGLFYEEEK